MVVYAHKPTFCAKKHVKSCTKMIKQKLLKFLVLYPLKWSSEKYTYDSFQVLVYAFHSTFQVYVVVEFDNDKCDIIPKEWAHKTNLHTMDKWRGEKKASCKSRPTVVVFPNKANCLQIR